MSGAVRAWKEQETGATTDDLIETVAVAPGTPSVMAKVPASEAPSELAGQNPPALAQWTDRIVLTLGALDTALELIEASVFIADRSGEILQANAVGYRLLERDEANVRASVAQMATTGSVRRPWELVPLPERGECLGYLAVLRSPPPSKPERNALSEATLRWSLTARQRDVLNLVALGLTNADVGGSLGIEICTVEYHLSAIFDKAGVDNRTTLIARLIDL